jgi:hypothetical protein
MKVSQCIGWLRGILDGNGTMGEYIGKASARVWLYWKAQDISMVAAFRLALKYYWNRKDREVSKMHDIRELCSHDFEGIKDWAGGRATVQSNYPMLVLPTSHCVSGTVLSGAWNFVKLWMMWIRL